jgi:hypothetical protein
MLTSAFVSGVAQAAPGSPSGDSGDAPIAPPTADAAQRLHLFLTENGVESSVADEITHSFEEGDLPDSATGVEPTHTETITNADESITRTFYPDGSVSVTGREIAAPLSTDLGGVTPMAISGCSVSSGSGYYVFRNCAIYGGNGVVYMGFHATYQFINGAYDKISSHNGPYQQCVVTCDVPYFAGAKLSENSSGNAYVTYFMRSTLATASRTSSLTLSVGGDRANSSFSY